MSDLNACKVLENGNIRLPKGRITFESLLEGQKDKKKPDRKAKHTLSIIFPKSADLTALIKKVDEVIAENFTAAQLKTTKIKKPFIKVEDQPKLADLAGDFPVMLRLDTYSKPGLVGPDGRTEITDQSEIYRGRWARPSVFVKYVQYKDDNGMVNHIIKPYLQNVQLLDHDTPIGGGGRSRAEDDFEAVGVAPGGTASSMFE